MAFTGPAQLPDPNEFKNPSIFNQILNAVATPISFSLDVLDTPAGIVRDFAAGESADSIIQGIFNPDKRATGRDVLNNIFGYTDNPFTVGGFDVGSFATALVLDPLLFTGSVTGLTKAGRAAESLANNLVSRSAAQKALDLAEKIAPDPTVLKATREIVTDLDQTIKRAVDAGVKPLERKIDESGIFRPLFKQQIDAGHRGFSLSLPFVEGEFVPTELNRLLEKPFQALSTVKEAITPKFVNRLFKSTPDQLELRVLKDLNKKIQREAQITDVINYLPETLASVDDFDRTRILAVIKEKKFLPDTEISLLEANPALVDELYKQEHIRAAVADFDRDVFTAAERVDAIKTRQAAQEASIAKLDLGYAARIDKLAAKEAEALKRAATPDAIRDIKDGITNQLNEAAQTYEKARNKINEKTADAIARIQKDLDQVTSRGEFPESLVKVLSQANQDVLKLQKAIGLDITELDAVNISYMRQVLTPEAQAFYLKAPRELREELQKEFRDELIKRTSVQKKRALSELTAVEKNAIFKKKYKVDFDFYNTNPRISMKNLSEQVTRGVGNAITLSSAINIFGRLEHQIGEEVTGFVSLSKVLKGSGLNAINLDAERFFKGKAGDFVRVTFDPRRSVNAIEQRLKDVKADILIPESVARDIGAAQKLNRGDISSLAKVLDPLNAVYRAAFTTHPAHLGTNILGFLHNNALAGVVDPRLYSDSIKFLSSFYRKARPDSDLARLLPKGGIIAEENAKYLDEFIRSGIADRGLISETTRILEEGLSVGRDSKFPHLAKALAFASNNRLTKLSKSVNRLADESSRAAHYIHMRKAGKSIIEAETSVRKYLFDYTELTPFEKEKLSKFVLFYTFTRKNLPFSIQQVWSNRGARGFAMASRDSLASQTAVPEYISEQGNIGLADGTFIDIRNPLYEANKFSPQGGGVERFFEKAASQLTPPIKLGIESVLGREIFRGRRLEDANRIDNTFVAKALESVGLAQQIETKSGTEHRLRRELVPLLNARPSSRFDQSLRDFTGQDPFLNLFGPRIRRNDPQELLAKTLRDRLLNIIKDDPRIRSFENHFSIENQPSDEVKRILDVLKDTSEVLRQ